MTDRSNLAKYYLEVSDKVKTLSDDPEKYFSDASEVAIEVLCDLGYNYESKDDLGEAVPEDVQTLLILAMARSNRLRQMFERLLANPEFFERLKEEEGW